MGYPWLKPKVDQLFKWISNCKLFINYKKNLNVIRFLITFFAVKQMCLSCEF